MPAGNTPGQTVRQQHDDTADGQKKPGRIINRAEQIYRGKENSIDQKPVYAVYSIGVPG